MGRAPSFPSLGKPMRPWRWLTAPALAFSAFWLLGFTVAIERLALPPSALIDPVWAQSDSQSSARVNHGLWAAFLEAYAAEDEDGVVRINYGRITQADKGALYTYISTLQSTDVRALNRAEQYAFWVNLYNARTVSLILENYPLKSIRRIRPTLLATGPWNHPVTKVLQKPLTLNQIESGIVRPIWNDPRLHYVFNCAAIGCPNLLLEPLTGANLEAQLEAAARAYVNDPRGVTVNPDGSVTLSKVFAWYFEDFGGTEESLLAHLRQYAEPALAKILAGEPKIKGYAYDWGLNDATPQSPAS